MRNKNIIIGVVAALFFSILLSGCDSDSNKTGVSKDSANLSQNVQVETPKEYATISNLEVVAGEFQEEKETNKVMIPINLTDKGTGNFDNKSIQGITFTVENFPKEVKSLMVKNVELTKDWMFASNLDENGRYLKASMITLDKINDLGTVAHLTLDKNELALLKEDLIIKTEITDGKEMYKLEDYKLKLKK